MLDAFSTSGTVIGSVKDSVSSNNGGGYFMQSGTSPTNNLTVVRSEATNNHTGVAGTDALSPLLWISETTITNNVLNCDVLGVGSFQDNIVVGNGGNCIASPATKQ